MEQVGTAGKQSAAAATDVAAAAAAPGAPAAAAVAAGGGSGSAGTAGADAGVRPCGGGGGRSDEDSKACVFHPDGGGGGGGGGVGGVGDDDDGGEACVVCLDVMERRTVTSCGHSFCSECIHDIVAGAGGASRVCPICRKPLTPSDLHDAVPEEEAKRLAAERAAGAVLEYEYGAK
eukprot:351436-Chlamydomonas_euryale.AAC.1